MPKSVFINLSNNTRVQLYKDPGVLPLMESILETMGVAHDTPASLLSPHQLLEHIKPIGAGWYHCKQVWNASGPREYNSICGPFATRQAAEADARLKYD